MDGNFEGTIEKLVLQLTDVEKFHPIHQLDFATSGVLAFL
jgi:23S rRNA-/tRNA-specific pseudouridylate synthase